jgi:predicted enzyme related to lactoylglutathione lyase
MRLEGITVDCLDKHALSAFWCALLGTTVRGEAAQYLGLHPVAPGHPRLVFQQVTELAPGRSRLHLDLETEDLEGDTARAVSLGATVVQVVEELGTSWHVLRDPEGNLFCLVPAS